MSSAKATAAQEKRKCKVVVIGDASVGKTCLLYSYAHPGQFLSEHVPTVFNNFEADISAANGDELETVRLTLWDTAGQEEYQQLRQMCYGGATQAAATSNPSTPAKEKDKKVFKEESNAANKSSVTDVVSVFVVCFSWNNPQSYTNVELKWYREIRQVAADLAKRSSSNGDGGARVSSTATRPFSVILVATKADLKSTEYGSSKNALKPSDGEILRRKIGADAFIECSAKTGEGVREVFDAALTSWYERHLLSETPTGENTSRRCQLL